VGFILPLKYIKMNKNWEITGYTFDLYDRFLATKDNKKLEIVFKPKKHLVEVYKTSLSAHYFNKELTPTLKVWITQFINNHNLDEIYTEIWESKDEDTVGKAVKI
jgi:hypothetical protein